MENENFLDLSNPIFFEMMNSLNMNIIEVMKEVYDGNFEEGEVNLKLQIDIENVTSPIYPHEEYKKPNFDYKVSRSLKKNESNSGKIRENLSLSISKKKFKLTKLKDLQRRLDDEVI